MSAYNVTAKRWTHGWELHVDGVGVTQTRTLASAEKIARDYIGLSLDIDDLHSFEVTITPELNPNLPQRLS